jgi:hypothetical protein
MGVSGIGSLKTLAVEAPPARLHRARSGYNVPD